MNWQRHLTFFLRVLAGAAFAAALPSHAQAPYPNRPVTLVVPYPAGGSADVLARALGQRLGERLGQTVVVDNRGGAATAIGAQAVARATPDGYTLLLGTVTSHAINPAMNKVGYDPVAGFTPIAPLASIPFVLVAHPAVPASTVADLVAMAKGKPGTVAYASAGPGTSNHLAGEVFAAQAGIKLLHVPYKGSAPALNDVLAGHVPVMFDLQATALPHVQGGKLKALAMTSRQRSSLLPNVPTMIEAGVPNYDVSAWFGLFAPAGLPRPIVDRLNAEVGTIFRSPEMRKQMQDLGAEPELAAPDAYAAFVKSEAAKWAETVKASGLATQ
ncbi:MAG TPA: tripartite tricarboxylate transporter substrate binding protein [Caldimonas sp.]|jgi:tripartite-type tricarboxylate transporter receptor subunit TctC|nr:tripartite tricarboxylate transporter substrate binding protein [Caldimonas sp.]HEX2542782.1 tripartite tricarboxylate transporter substrate binding protein [Caldimonas sp.]